MWQLQELHLLIPAGSKNKQPACCQEAGAVVEEVLGWSKEPGNEIANLAKVRTAGLP